jgi:hypothetical protein
MVWLRQIWWLISLGTGTEHGVQNKAVWPGSLNEKEEDTGVRLLRVVCILVLLYRQYLGRKIMRFAVVESCGW